MLFMECLEKEEQSVLRKLVAKGWLRRQEGNLLIIHPIICQVCREELKPSDEVCQGFVDNLRRKYDKVDYNFLRYVQMAECFSNAMEYLEDKNGDFSIPVPDYVEENVSTKVVKIIQSYVGIVNKMVWRKDL